MGNAGNDRPPRERRSWRLGLSWLFGLLVLATVVLVAAKIGELEHFAEIARDAEPAWLLAAFVLQAMTYVCAAGVWQGALWRAGEHRSFRSIVPLGLAKLFADQALPTGGIGGTVLVVAGLGRRGVARPVGMAALLIGLLSFYAAYLTAVIVALAILYRSHALDPAMVAAAALFVLVAAGIPTFVLLARRWLRRGNHDGPMATLNRWLGRVPGYTTLTTAMAQAPGRLLRDPLAFAIGYALQLAVFALDAGTLWIMLHAVNANAAPDVAIAAFVMASLAATVGPMPLGLGTFEAVCVAVLNLQGVSIEAALTATLLLRGFTFWLPMIPGLLLARRELHPAAHREHRV